MGKQGVSKDMIEEGKVSKGGVNRNPPTSEWPGPPARQRSKNNIDWKEVMDMIFEVIPERHCN